MNENLELAAAVGGMAACALFARMPHGNAGFVERELRPKFSALYGGDEPRIAAAIAEAIRAYADLQNENPEESDY